MTSEHVKLTSSESIYAQRGLLESQANLINSLKREKSYKRLRKEELSLKIALKTKLDELNVELDVLDKILPRTQLKIEKEEKEHSHEAKESLSLDEELDEIKRKLSRLQE